MADSIRRVLQIVEPFAPGEGYCLLKQINDEVSGIDSEVLLVGTSRDGAMARELGMKNVHLLPRMPRRIWPLAGTIRNWIHRRETECGAFDRIQVWSSGGQASATLGAMQRPLTYILYATPDDSSATKSLSKILETPGSRLITLGESVYRYALHANLNLDQVEVRDPNVDARVVDHCQREEQRRAWGVEEGTLVLGVLAEPMSYQQAILASKILIRYTATGRKVKLILSSQLSKRVELERELNHLGLSSHLIIDDILLQPWESASGLDIALCPGGSGRASPWPALWALAQDVKVIAEDVPSLRDIQADESKFALIQAGNVNEMCQSIIKWQCGPVLETGSITP